MVEARATKLKIGDIIEAEVFKVTSFGAFAKLPNGRRALIHISQLSDNFVKDINQHIKLGDKIKARILNIEGGKIDLTLKKPKEDIASYPKGKEFKPSSFEDKLDSFLSTSEERLEDLKQNIESKQQR
jgi:S1 RNA binding domain protein